MPRRSTNWLAYVATFFTAIGLGWTIGNAWFQRQEARTKELEDLRTRVTVLEQRDHYVHGAYQVPQEEK